MIVVPDLLSFALANVADKPAVVGDRRSLTFADVDARATRLVAWLTGVGAGHGDRVALLARNEIEYLEIQLACCRGGFILVPINFRLAAPEIGYILEDSGACVLIHGAEFASAPETAQPVIRLSLGEPYESALAQTSRRPTLPTPLDAAQPCVILYTSGTTGRPKGAVLSNQALYARVNANLFDYKVGTDDVFLQCLPMFHIASNVSYGYLFGGATNVFMKEFSPEAMLRLVAEHQVTSALLVPTMINALVNSPALEHADHRSLTTLIYGASPIPPVVLASAVDRLGCRFFQAFGMTETSAVTLLRPADHDPLQYPERLASAGRGAVGMVVRVVDDQDHDVAIGEVGEIICQGPALMTGYWNNPEATAVAMRGGWMHTGDLGYRDADGFLFVTDRKKDMIITGGENVYPREVEDVLFEHPGILEAAVIGVPDPHWGERVHAVVVLRAERPAEAADILSFARTKLAGYKVPKTLEIVELLPKNATGKVLKTELRERWSAPSLRS